MNGESPARCSRRRHFRRHRLGPDRLLLARHVPGGPGDIVLTYDPVGQGTPEGSLADLFAPPMPDCTFGGACRYLQDVVAPAAATTPSRPAVDLFAVHAASVARSRPPHPTPTDPAAGVAPRQPAITTPPYEPQGREQRRPHPPPHRPVQVAVVGHSMGALSLLDYLWNSNKGHDGADGQPLPPLATGIALVGCRDDRHAPRFSSRRRTSTVPHSHSARRGGVDLGPAARHRLRRHEAALRPAAHQTDPARRPVADRARGRRAHRLHRHALHHPHPVVAAVSAHYATSWLDCYLAGRRPDCLTAIPARGLTSPPPSPARPPGPEPHCPARAGASPCPPRPALNDSPSQLGDALSGHPDYTCTP